LRDSYTRYLEQLEGDYKETFDLINVYVGTQRLDEDTQEEKMSELLDIFIAAQKSGKPVEKIVGTDVKQFCRNFCEGDGFKSRLLHIADFFRTISIFVLIYCGFEFIVLAVSNGKICNLWTYSGQLNMTGYLLGSILVLLVGFVVDVVLRQLLFCYVKIANKMRNIIVILVMIASFPVMMYFMDIDDNVLWNCPLWILFVISGIYIFAYQFF